MSMGGLVLNFFLAQIVSHLSQKAQFAQYSRSPSIVSLCSFRNPLNPKWGFCVTPIQNVDGGTCLEFLSRSNSFALEPKGSVCSIFSLPEHRFTLFVQKSAEPQMGLLRYPHSKCRWGDLNPHGSHHMHLKHACLPFQHIDVLSYFFKFPF